MIKIEVVGDKELARRIEQLIADDLPPMLEQALAAGAMLVSNDAKHRAPYRTGNLRRSIHVGGHERPEVGEDIGGNHHDPDGAEVLVGTSVEYAKWVEYGTAAHLIRPRQKKALWWKDLPHPVRLVSHPGTQAKPFLRPAMDSQRDAVAKAAGEALKGLLQAWKPRS